MSRLEAFVGRGRLHVIAFAGAVSLAGAAWAVPTITAPTTTGASVGSFTIRAQDPTSTDAIGGYTVTLKVVPETGSTGALMLTGVSPATGALLTDAPVSGLVGSLFVVNDAALSGTPTLGSTSVPLFNVNYSATGASGKFDISLFTAPSTDPQYGISTTFNTPAGGLLPTAVSPGVITVAPEPGSLALLGGLAGLFLARRPRGMTR